ncbi:uncharacterized protein LOC119350495 [Triticum dicoccoides]|uniref:uncharacterized protein LOC119350495 n=1 Tax=Triticum dicoccoides TaxID=85692 RepID=UPI00188F0A57|nr:uncharacterized protein LOC119350495 [Triticum dicoccoides]
MRVCVHRVTSPRASLSHPLVSVIPIHLADASHSCAAQEVAAKNRPLVVSACGFGPIPAGLRFLFNCRIFIIIESAFSAWPARRCTGPANAGEACPISTIMGLGCGSRGMTEKLQHSQIQLCQDIPDSIIWRITKSGCYSAQSAYRFQHLGLQSSGFFISS